MHTLREYHTIVPETENCYSSFFTIWALLEVQDFISLAECYKRIITLVQRVDNMGFVGISRFHKFGRML